MNLAPEDLAELSEYYQYYLDELAERPIVRADAVGLRQVVLAAIAKAASGGMIHFHANELLNILEAELPRPPAFLTLAEAASLTGIRHATLRRACYDGRLPAVKSGGTWLVDVADLDEYVERHACEGRGRPASSGEGSSDSSPSA